MSRVQSREFNSSRVELESFGVCDTNYVWVMDQMCSIIHEILTMLLGLLWYGRVAMLSCIVEIDRSRGEVSLALMIIDSMRRGEDIGREYRFF